MNRVKHEMACEFLRCAYRPDDWIAVLVKSSSSRRAGQRIVPVSLAIAPAFQTWLAREHAQHSADIFVSVNTFSSRLVSRSRFAVTAIRHVFVDADRDSAEVVASIAARRELPPPSYVVHSSPGRGHILWRVTEFSVARVEGVQKRLAKELSTDPVATSAVQMTRLPGYWNHKRCPGSLVTVTYRDAAVMHVPSEFSVPTAMGDARALPRSRQFDRLCACERARRYVASMPPAVAGRHGDARTFRLCCRLVRGFALSDDEALAALHEWNARCEPPWSARELMLKIRNARRYGREPIEGLVERRP